MTSSGPDENVQVAIYPFVLLKYIKRKSASLELLIGHIALMVGALWPNNDN